MFPSHNPTRRVALRSIVGGSLAFPAILLELLAADSARPADPLAPRKPHFEPKAKRVIWLFSTGGVSQMDAFDPKPKLFAADGKTLGVGGGLSLSKTPLLRPRWEFRPGGKCGTMVSDLFPHIRAKMDDICLVRSMTQTTTNTSRRRWRSTPAHSSFHGRASAAGSATALAP